MAPRSCAHFGTANKALESFRAARTALTPKSELALTTLVVIALAAGAAVVSVAALSKQAQYSNADLAMSTNAGAMHADIFNKVEPAVLDHDLYPSCFSVGDNKLASAPGKQTGSRDNRTFKDVAGRVSAHESLAAAKEGQATGDSLLTGRPAADPTRRPKEGFVAGISDQGCGVGNYK